MWFWTSHFILFHVYKKHRKMIINQSFVRKNVQQRFQNPNQSTFGIWVWVFLGLTHGCPKIVNSYFHKCISKPDGFSQQSYAELGKPDGQLLVPQTNPLSQSLSLSQSPSSSLQGLLLVQQLQLALLPLHFEPKNN